jgi:hypothetical protein
MQDGIMLPGRTSIVKFTGAMEVLALSAVPNAKKALVIGLGAGVLPANLTKRGIQAETVEINPQMAEVCANWFDPAGSSRVRLEDGRRYLRVTRDTFDIVFLDAFTSDDVPSHLLTREAFTEARDRLSVDGALVLNYVGFSAPPSSRVIATIAATLKSVFPSVEVFGTGENRSFANFIFVARRRAGGWDPAPETLWADSRILKAADLLEKRIQLDEPYPFLITDDYCPLEWLDRETRFMSRKENSKEIPLSAFGI